MPAQQGPSQRVSRLVVVAVLLMMCQPGLAAITAVGSLVPAYDGTSDPWLLSTDLTVGAAVGTSSLTITGGSDVNNVNAMSFIGSPDLTGILATVNVQDAGSTFVTDKLLVGPLAEGRLNVTNGGAVTSGESIVGGQMQKNELDQVTGFSSGEGTATVSGAGSQWESSWLFVGMSGHGALNVNNGGTVNVTGDSDSTLMVGTASDGTGEVTVNGGTLSVGQDVALGVWGEAFLTVSNGGHVDSANGQVGATDTSGWENEPYLQSLGHANGVGTATVTGAGSQWNVSNNLLVGGWGTGNLSIENGGAVTVGQQAFIGGMPITLGAEDPFSRDMLPNGSGAVTVTGDNSTLTVTGGDTLFVGYSGTGLLNVTAGGDVNSPSVVVGGAPGADGTVTVSGTGSTLSARQEIDVGVWGTGHLTVLDQGAVSTGNLLIGGLDANDVNDLPPQVLADFGAAKGTGTVTVTGANSTLDVGRTTYVGNYGQGTLNVTNGGQATSGEIAVGVAPGSHGVVNVIGANSHLSTDANAGVEEDGYYPGVMIVGGYGQGEVTVSGGGQLTVDDVLYLGGYKPSELDFNSVSVGHDPNGTGTVTVTGAGSTLSADILAVGVSGQGTVNVLNGATATSRMAMIGITPEGRGAVVVDNSGDTWANSGSAFVGGYGQGSLSVSNGGHASIGEILYVGGFDPEVFDFNTAQYGYDPNGTGTVTVTGSDSVLQAYGIGVGVAGNGTLEILNGGRVEGQVVGAGFEAGGTGAILVDGTGSTLQLSGNGPLPESVVAQGEGALTISNGGTVNVAGPNAVLVVAGDTLVGSEGEGTMTISTGQVTTGGLYIGGSDMGSTPASGTVTVTGTDSRLNVTGDFPLIVGYSWTGTLNVNDDGRVTTESMVVGGGLDVTGTLTVDGGHVLASHEIIAGAWGHGDMTISNGGDVTTETMSIGGFDDSNAPEDLKAHFGDPHGSGTVMVTDSGSSLNITGNQSLYVGYSGGGGLAVNLGGYVASETAGIGVLAGSQGGVVVGGYGDANDPSTWDNSGSMFVGGYGYGSLRIEDSGQVHIGDSLYIGGFDPCQFGGDGDLFGNEPNGTGEVTVTDAGSLLDVTGITTLYVGYSGNGTLYVFQGAQVNTNTMVVGAGPGAVGTVSIDDPNSTISASGGVIVGAWGEGHLGIGPGGSLTAGGLAIGGFDPCMADPALLAQLGDPNGTGGVLVSGPGSSLTVTGTGAIAVGAGGTGTLGIQDGASVISKDSFIGGYLTFDHNDVTSMDDVQIHGGTGSVEVRLPGTTWQSDIVVVGTGGSGTLDVTEGGQVSDYLGVIGLGPQAAGRATVSGPNSVWTTAAGDISEGDPFNGTLIVGGWGSGDLEVSNGGRVDTVTTYIGGFNLDELGGGETPTNWGLGDPAGSGVVTVTGTGSTLSASGGNTLYVGYSGNGTLNILDGGRVDANTAVVGALPDANGLVVVDGAGSTLSIAGSTADPNAIAQGQGEVVIRNGGLVEVKDPNGLLAVGGNITVGAQGADSEMVISNGANVFSQRGIIGGYDPEFDTLDQYFDEDTVLSEGEGTVTVTGAGSRWNTANVVVGFAGQGTMNIANGGRVDSQSGFIGMTPGATGHVELTNGSLWTNAGDLVVGAWGTGTLDILGGSEVYALDAYISGMPTGVLGGLEEGAYDQVPNGPGVVNVDGLGSALRITAWDSLWLGYYGNGALNVTNGGLVESDVGRIGVTPGSTGRATIDGVAAGEPVVPSEWHNMGPMYVGGEGTGSMTVSNGGRVTVDNQLYIGGYSRTVFGEVILTMPTGTGDVTVTGTGSLLTIGGTFDVGYSGAGTLRVENGGQVTSTSPGSAYIGHFSTGSATVTGLDSQWTESGALYVGYFGQGSLLVEDGGQVLSDEGFIGYSSGSTGTVEVGGLYSNWQVVQNLYVGGNVEGAGGTGTLMVNQGGDVQVGGELIIWNTGRVGGDGTISVAEATTVHNYGTIAPGDNGIGTLDIYGNVVFHEGSTYAVQIANDNTSDKLQVGGDVTIDGGTVQVSSHGTIIGQHDYEIINAYGVTGTFDVLDTALLHFAVSDANLGYDESSVWLHLTAANFNDPNIARTYNQRQVAGAMQQIAGEESDNPITGALQQLPQPGNVRHAYDQLSGQTRPPLSSLTAAGTSRFLGTVTSRLQTLQGGLVDTFSSPGLLAMAGPDSSFDGGHTYDVSPQGQTFGAGNGTATLGDMPWGVWGRAYGLYGDRETEREAPGYNYTVYGASVGLDYQFTDALLGGLVVGMSNGKVDFAKSRDNTEFDATHVGLYGSAAWDKWYVNSAATLARLEFDTERIVDLLGERLTGSFCGYEMAAYVEAGRNWQVAPDLLLQPLASVQYSYLKLDSYAERGGASALSFDEQTQESVKGSLGARLTRTLIETMGEFRADVQVRGRWVHEFGDDQASVDTFFTSNPAATFTVRDAEIARDSAVLGAGLIGDLSKHVRAYVDYDTRLNSDESLHVISASLQYRW